jgi:hypothetical protein
MPRSWEEPTLFDDEAHARTFDPMTSHDAAASVDVSLHRRYVLALLAFWGPFTDEGLVDALDRQEWAMSPSSARSRRAELTRSGHVEACGQERLRSGRRAIVWRLTDAGWSLFQRVQAEAMRS